MQQVRPLAWHVQIISSHVLCADTHANHVASIRTEPYLTQDCITRPLPISAWFAANSGFSYFLVFLRCMYKDGGGRIAALILALEIWNRVWVLRLRVASMRRPTLRSWTELLIFYRAASLDATLCGELAHSMSHAALRSPPTLALRLQLAACAKTAVGASQL